MNRQTILQAPLILACLFFLTSCDGGIGVMGRVLDEQGKPIKGAKVVLISRGHKDEGESRDDGSYDVGMVHEPRTPTGTLTVSKEGYETYQLSFNSREDVGRERDIVLKASATPKVESK